MLKKGHGLQKYMDYAEGRVITVQVLYTLWSTNPISINVGTLAMQ